MTRISSALALHCSRHLGRPAATSAGHITYHGVCPSFLHGSEHLLELLHGEDTHCLRSGLRLEDTWLLGEGVDTLACLRGRLVLQLHVEHPRELEGARLRHLRHSHGHQRFHDTLRILGLQPCGLGHRLEHSSLRHRPARLHGLGCWRRCCCFHCLHRLLHRFHRFHRLHCL